MKLLVIGDSILKRQTLNGLISFPKRIFNDDIDLYINGNCSFTTNNLKDIKSSYDYIIIHIGICDVFLRYPDGLNKYDEKTAWNQNVPINIFKKNIDSFIKRCSIDSVIVLSSIIKPDVKFLHIGGFNYNNILDEQINKYNMVLSNFEKYSNVVYINLVDSINKILEKYRMSYNDIFCDASGHITEKQNIIDIYGEMWKNAIKKVPEIAGLLRI